MSDRFRVVGAGQLRELAVQLKEIEARDLSKEMRQGLRKATAPLSANIQVQAVARMPSGYGPVLSKSLRFRTSITSGRRTARVSFRVYGDGQQDRRDVPAINRGTLRHPVHGHRKRAWIAQKVTPRFVDDPVDKSVSAVHDEMGKVLDHIAAEIARG